MNQMNCNQCGKKIMSVDGVMKDYIHIEKKWGYFSRKDLEHHEIYLCEDCYDQWVKGFLLPVNVTEIDEVL